MSRFKALAKLLGKSIDEIEKLSPKVINQLEKENNLVPYKILDNEGDLILKSPKAEAKALFHSPEIMEEYDPAFKEIAQEFNNPVYIPSLEAEKGYGAKALKTLEQAAKKRGADVAYLNASPLGGTRGLSQEDAAKKLQEFYKSQGYKIAEDQGVNTLMYKKLATLAALAGVALTPEEAEAGLFNRKTLETIIKNLPKVEGQISKSDLVKSLELSPMPKDYNNNLKKMSELLGHINLEKLGIPEDNFKPVEYLLKEFPEAEKLDKILIDKKSAFKNPIDNDFLKQINSPGTYLGDNIGMLATQSKGNIINPYKYMTPHTLLVNTDKTDSLHQLAGVISHEGQHLRDTLIYPNTINAAYPKLVLDELGNVKIFSDNPKRVSEILNNNPEIKKEILKKLGESNPKLSEIAEKNPELSIKDVSILMKLPKFAEYYSPKKFSEEQTLELLTKNHHSQYPGNYELDRSLDILNNKKDDINTQELKQSFDKLRNDFLNTNNIKKAAAFSAVPALNIEKDISPMSAAKDIQEQILNPVVSRYNKLKSYITNPLAKQLDLTKDKSEAKSIKQALDMGLDPVNLIPGAAGIGAGALQMLGEEDEDE